MNFGSNSFPEWLTGLLLTSGHASVLIGLVLLVQTVFGKWLTPAWRFNLWLLVVARLLMPVVPSSRWSVFNVLSPSDAVSYGTRTGSTAPAFLPRNSVAPPAAKALGNESRAATAALPSTVPSAPVNLPAKPIGMASPLSETPVQRQGRSWSWRDGITFIWGAGALILVTRLLWTNLRFTRRLAQELPMVSGSAIDLLRECQKTLGIARDVCLIETAEIDAPAVCGFWRKRLLLPAGILARLTRDELRCVFLHELAHIRRRDIELSWLVSALQALHWFNPALWWGFARMRADRESACDTLALGHLEPKDRVTYGEAIIKVIEELARPVIAPGLLGLSEDRMQIQRRLEKILSYRKPSSWSALASLLIVALALLGLTDAKPTILGAPPGPLAGPQALRQKAVNLRIVDTNGIGIAGATVSCQGFDWSGTSDLEGRVTWLDAGRSYSYRVDKEGYRMMLLPPISPNRFERLVTLERALVIRGQVLDAATGRPIPSFKVYPGHLVMAAVPPGLEDASAIRGTDGAFRYSFSMPFEPSADSVLYVEAAGYAPAISKPLASGDNGQELRFLLRKSEPVPGRVEAPDGLPAREATVELWSGQLNLTEIPVRHRTQTAADGTFAIIPAVSGGLFVHHASGYAELTWAQFKSQPVIRLQRWGRVQGLWSKPVPAVSGLLLEGINWTDAIYTFRPHWINDLAKVDRSGEFTFRDLVPPGEYRLGEVMDLNIRQPGGGTSRMLLQNVRATLRVEPGQTSVVEIAAGRPVVGRLDLGDETNELHQPVITLHSEMQTPKLSDPPPNPGLSPEEKLRLLQDQRSRLETFWLSDAGKALRRSERIYRVIVPEDNAFRFDHVEPGTYRLFLNPGKSGEGERDVGRDVVIPQGDPDKPVDLGTLRANGVTPAQTAPDASDQEPEKAVAIVHRPEPMAVLPNTNQFLRIVGTVVDAQSGKPIRTFRFIPGRAWGQLPGGAVQWDWTKGKASDDGVFDLRWDSAPEGMPANAVPWTFIVEANGYLPGETPRLVAGRHELQIRLQKGDSVTGVAVTPSGEPVSGAEVIIDGLGYAELDRRKLEKVDLGKFDRAYTRTDAQGRFTLPAIFPNPQILGVHTLGCGRVTGQELATLKKLVLQPWGRVEGTLRIGNRLGTNMPVSIGAAFSPFAGVNYYSDTFNVTTDEQGRFVFTDVPAGKMRLMRWAPSRGTRSGTHQTEVDVLPGEITPVVYGGNGASIVGKVVLQSTGQPFDWTRTTQVLETARPGPSIIGVNSGTQPHRLYVPDWLDDGHFRIDDVAPDQYVLRLKYVVESVTDSSGQPLGKGLASKQIDVSVPQAGSKTQPLDLGTIILPDAPVSGSRP